MEAANARLPDQAGEKGGGDRATRNQPITQIGCPAIPSPQNMGADATQIKGPAARYANAVVVIVSSDGDHNPTGIEMASASSNTPQGMVTAAKQYGHADLQCKPRPESAKPCRVIHRRTTQAAIAGTNAATASWVSGSSSDPPRRYTPSHGNQALQEGDRQKPPNTAATLGGRFAQRTDDGVARAGRFIGW